MHIYHCSGARIAFFFFFLPSKSENCTSPNGLWIIAYCFQSTEFKTPLPTVLFETNAYQVFNCAKHRKCRSYVYRKQDDHHPTAPQKGTGIRRPRQCQSPPSKLQLWFSLTQGQLEMPTSQLTCKESIENLIHTVALYWTMFVFHTEGHISSVLNFCLPFN